jgi:hypothetical protein
MHARSLTLLLSLALCGTAAADRGAPAVHPISPLLSAAHAPVIRAVLDRASAEVGAVATQTKAQVTATAAYGSWFLPHIVQGGDLDVLAVFDLGDAPSGEALVRGVESVLGAFAQRKGRDDPTMALLAVEGLGPDGALEHRARAVALVDAALAALDQGVGPTVSYPHGDRRAPYTYEPGHVSLPVHPRAKYLSNAFRPADPTAAHVREVSVQFFFVAHRGGKTVVLEPLYRKAASPIRIWRFLFETAFPDPASRDRFAAVAGAGLDLDLRRTEYGAFILTVAGMEIASGKRPIKGAKRLLQSFLMAEPALDPKVAAAFRAEIAQWLRGPAALLDDLDAVAGIFAKAARTGAEGAFRKSGDVERVLTAYEAALKPWAPKVPGLAALTPLIQAVRSAGPADRAAAWKSLAKAGSDLARTAGPPRARLDHWFGLLSAVWRGAGVRMVPVVGTDESAVWVPDDAPKTLGLDAKAITWGGAWPIELSPKRGTPVRHLFVRADVDPAAARAWAAMRAAFATQASGFKLSK